MSTQSPEDAKPEKPLNVPEPEPIQKSEPENKPVSDIDNLKKSALSGDDQSTPSGIHIHVDQLIQHGDMRFGGNWSDLEDRANVTRNADSCMTIVQKSELDRIYRIYVECQPFGSTLNILEERRVILLYGERRSGKSTAALRLMQSFRHKHIYKIDDSISFKRIAQLDFQPNTGYLIEITNREADYSVFTLSKIQEKLTSFEKPSHLVIISHHAPRTDDIQHYTCPWLPQFDGAQILQKHLNFLYKESGEEVDTLLSSPSVLTCITSLKSPSAIEALANLLVRVLKKEVSIEDALKQFDTFGENTFRDWFDKLPTDGQLFVTALAVLQGCSTSEQYSGAVQFRDLIIPPVPNTTPTNSFFTLTKEAIEKETLARLQTLERNSDVGTTYGDTWAWMQPEYSQKILLHTWQERPYLRPKLLQWLHQLAGSPSDMICVAAATSVGILIGHAFDDIRQSVLLSTESTEPGWAISHEPRLRSIAGVALAIATLNEQNTAVANLLRRWSKSEEIRLCWTATYAYGTGAAYHRTEQAIQDLFAILDRCDIQLIPVAIQSIERIFALGRTDPRFYADVIDGICQHLVTSKTKDDSKRSSPNAPRVPITWSLIVFSRLMFLLDDSEGSEYPAILTLSSKNKDYRDKIAELLIQAFNHSDTQGIQRQNLRKWFDSANDSKPLRKMLTELIHHTVLKEYNANSSEGNVTYLFRKMAENGQPTAVEMWRRIFGN